MFPLTSKSQMRKFLIPFLALCLAGCNEAGKFHIKGNISGAEGKTLYFIANSIDGVTCLDSTKLKGEGAFDFSAKNEGLCPEFYTLSLEGNLIHLSVDSTETITIKASMETMATDYSVEGSDNCQKIKEISARQHQLQNQIVALEQNKSMYPGDITDSIKSLIDAYKQTMTNDYIFKEPMQAYAYYAVSQVIRDLSGGFLLFDPYSDRADIKVYATVATAWDGAYHDAPRTEQLCNQVIEGMNNTARPETRVVEVDQDKIQETGLIDVSLPDVDGNLHTLTSLKGKVVMLDFTQYGAAKSNERIRLMRSLYEKYSPRGFEIYQVSLDDDLSFWRYQSENLPWICVHETNGTATKVYGVSILPTYFLISRGNEVVKRSEMVSDVEKEIEALL